MKVEGKCQIPVPRERVWEILMDPAFLKQAIPGCEELVEEGDRRYRLTIKAGVGAINSSFTGQVRLEELRPPERYRMVTSAQGKVGFVNGSGDIELEPKEGGTEVRYRGEMQVGGMLAAVGSRLIQAAFRKSVNDFFAAVTDSSRSG